MGTRTDNTMAEALFKLNKDIAEMKTLSDADMPFLVQLETIVLNRLKQPVDDLRAQGALPPAGPPQMTQPGIPGVGGLPPMPSGDELSRMLSQGPAGLPV